MSGRGSTSIPRPLTDAGATRRPRLCTPSASECRICGGTDATAASLHEEVGIAQTTVADIARRAGVQRLTVYNHFPDLAALLPACSAHWMAAHPLPDLGPAFALPDPVERLRSVLAGLYGWYRENATMQRHTLGDRATVPELDAYLTGFADPAMAGLADALVEGMADALAAGFERDGARALVGVALDFWTWRRLDREGLGDDDAAALMTAVVRGG